MDQGRNLLNTLFSTDGPSNQDPVESTSRPQPPQQQQLPNPNANTQYMTTSPSQASTKTVSPPANPLSAGSTNPSVNSNINEGRQNLLSLLNSVPGAPSGRDYAQRQPDPSSPPMQNKGTGSTLSTESQGKKLLEQLMSDNSSQSTVSREKQFPSYEGLHQGSSYTANQQTPSPTRQSMFDFVSPFDAFSQPSSLQSVSSRRNPPQSSGTSAIMVSSSDDSGLMKQPQDPGRPDPKRKSVDNLMETLTRGPPNQQEPDILQDVSVRPTEARVVPPRQQTTPQDVQSQAAKLTHHNSPPAHVIPRDQTQVRNDIQSQSNWKAPDTKGKLHSKIASPPDLPPSQNICFDVSQAMEVLQAPPQSSFSTPIALVKVEPTFLPGSTIGATSWIAYAMTRGRVRVISRASGDRTLLQLPTAFPPSTSVVDMAVFGNRLAGVTSDGGFIVWELPTIITDDVPGKLLLCVIPPPEPEVLQSVRWHPKQPDTVAVASESRIYLINITEASRRFDGDPVAQNDLSQVGPIITLSSPLIAFAFDVPHVAIATISEDSTLELWQISNQQPFWSARIPGESVPSSIDFLDGGIVIGRKNGTIFQLLSVMSDRVLSTLKFIDTQSRDDRDMFGHVAYDARIQTLWVANSRRESILALRLGFETSSKEDQQVWHPRIDQILEFVGPKPSIHFVILTADSDPDGEEAEAACVAAKLEPGSLAMVAFSVHASGVDQVIIRKEWFDTASQNALARLPLVSSQVVNLPGTRSAPSNVGEHSSPVRPGGNLRPASPPSEEGEGEPHKREERHPLDKGRNKGKAVGFKDETGKDLKEKDKLVKLSESPALSEPVSTGPWAKDLRKTEEILHTRIGRTISKELEKLEQRLEEARAIDRAAEMARQEQIIKLISTELTRNTTRVVELAVKSEVQNSVLPAIEAVARSEIKSATTGQLSKGFGDSLKQILPSEMERLLIRSDLSNHIAKVISSAINPLLEKQLSEAVSNNLIPAYAAESSAMHREVSRELRSEILNLKKEIVTWQSEALRSQEGSLRDLEQSMRTVQEQLKYLATSYSNPTPSTGHVHQHRGSPGIPTSPHSHMRGDIRAGYTSSQGSYVQGPQSWYPATQHPTMVPSNIGTSQAPPQSSMTSMTGGSGSDMKAENWDETYVEVLGTQDPRKLRELLVRSNPEIIMPLNAHGPLSQAVVLTLIHRLSASLGESSPVDENFKTALWWLQRSANILNPNDPLISPYVGRVLPNIKSMLNTTKSRLSLLPGGPPLLEANRTITDIQEMIMRKS